MQHFTNKLCRLLSQSEYRQLTQVKIALEQQKRGYSPAQDFYKRIREGIQDFHRAGQEDKNDLDLIVNSQTDQKKKTAYPLVLAGYQKFLGRKSFQWFDPPREVYSPISEFSINVNPELGLQKEDGTRLLVKLYFKDAPLSKHKVNLVHHLLKESLEDGTGYQVGLLDIRRGKLFCPTVEINGLDILLEGQAMTFLTMWRRLSNGGSRK